MKKKNQKNKNSGMILLQTIVFASIVVIMISALSSFAATTIKAGRVNFNREQAFQAAEAGIDYYRWHLAHAPADYKDGTGITGPYVHSLKDRDGNTVGQFSLNITAPPLGSTIVQIQSTGTSALDSSYPRKIKSSVAKPSIAKFAVAGNNAMRFGTGTEIFGPIHVNGGIRFDGLAHNLVTSGATTYTDSDSDACTTSNSYGVHTCLSPQDPTSPTTLPVRPDVFEAGRLISQPTIDFSGFTTDLAILKTDAQSPSGFYRNTAGSGYVGFHLVLKTNDTFDLYKINSWAGLGNCSSSPSGTLSYSIGTQTLQGNYPFPANGTIFIEDNLVIDGQINGARLTVTAADLPVPSDPDNYKNVIINNDLTYTNYNGTDSLGIIAQNGIMVGMISDDNLKIDGALIAQNDRVGRFYYSGGSCAYKNRALISLFGMIASYARYGFAYTDGTGYATRSITYDANLLYAPPPSFPLTSAQYQILSWQEIK
jgi:type II secretory pathway pseudopilin PulG